MEATYTRLTDEKVDQILAKLLRAGVLVAAGLVTVGGVLLLVQQSNTVHDKHIFRGEPRELRKVPGIIADATHGDSLGIIQLGLLVLMATPVARVAFSIVAFSLQRDWLYVAFTMIVLAILLYSLTGSRAV
jgi:uncharacterized membrane protein